MFSNMSHHHHGKLAWRIDYAQVQVIAECNEASNLDDGSLMLSYHRVGRLYMKG